MRLRLDSDPHVYLIRSYGDGGIVIGERRFERPMILTPQRLLTEWSAPSLAALGEPDMEVLYSLGAQILLLGAGDTQAFASARIREGARARGFALECMTLGAACRTYNVLAGEGRLVAAGLFP